METVSPREPHARKGTATSTAERHQRDPAIRWVDAGAMIWICRFKQAVATGEPRDPLAESRRILTMGKLLPEPYGTEPLTNR